MPPKLWSETIEGHRHALRDAVLDATAALVDERGLTGVTMSAVAESAGVGRATLYKYFPDIESVLTAWHRREAARHLTELADAEVSAEPGHRLEAVMAAYAVRLRGRRHGEFAAWLHHDAELREAHAELHELFRDLIAAETAAGTARTDLDPAELAHYCLHALGAAGSAATDETAVRIATVVRDGMRVPKHE